MALIDSCQHSIVCNRYLLLLIALSATTAVAQAQTPVPAQSDDNDYINPDRPGIADGSNVIGKKRYQIETGFQREFRKSGEVKDDTFFFPTLFRIGVSDKFELRVEGNTYTNDRVRDPAMGTITSVGMAPTSLGFKYHFQDSKGIGHPSVGAIVRVFPSSGSGAFRTDHTTADARLALDWDVAPKISLNPNLGVAVYESGGETFTTGLAALTVNYSPTNILSFFVDGGLQSPEEPHGKTVLVLDTGVAYLLNKNVQLDFSIGTGVAGATPPHPFIGAGISVRF